MMSRRLAIKINGTLCGGASTKSHSRWTFLHLKMWLCILTSRRNSVWRIFANQNRFLHALGYAKREFMESSASGTVWKAKIAIIWICNNADEFNLVSKSFSLNMPVRRKPTKTKCRPISHHRWNSSCRFWISWLIPPRLTSLTGMSRRVSFVVVKGMKSSLGKKVRLSESDSKPWFLLS